MVRLSILDYSQIDEGKDAEQALQDTIRLAKLADATRVPPFLGDRASQCACIRV